MPKKFVDLVMKVSLTDTSLFFQGEGTRLGSTKGPEKLAQRFFSFFHFEDTTVVIMAEQHPLTDAKYNWRHVHGDLEAGKLIGNYGGNHVRFLGVSFPAGGPSPLVCSFGAADDFSLHLLPIGISTPFRVQFMQFRI
jgi:hypothetical protein